MIGTPALTVMTANLHLFGQLARVGPDKQKTPLYYMDSERIDPIVGYIDRKRPAIVGLQEIWDPMIQYELARQLRGTYPYQLFTPWERGVQGAIDVLSDKIGIDDEFLEERTSKVVRDLAQSHYQLNNSFVWNLLAKMVPEDLTMRLLQRVFGVNHFMGAGLLFLSRYPIDTMQSRFEAYEAKADLERFATKGVLKTVVTVPGTGPVTCLLTHLQEGTSKKSVAVRVEQLRTMRRIIDHSDYPVIAMGDFNIGRDVPFRNEMERRRRPRRTEEYKRMLEILALRDAYPVCQKNLRDNPGPTYLHGPIARNKGIPDTTTEQMLVLDYVLYDSNFEPTGASVDDRDFYLDSRRLIPLSDHRPLSIVLTKRF